MNYHLQEKTADYHKIISKYRLYEKEYYCFNPINDCSPLLGAREAECRYLSGR